jgi:hypothetical protein
MESNTKKIILSKRKNEYYKIEVLLKRKTNEFSPNWTNEQSIGIMNQVYQS